MIRRFLTFAAAAAVFSGCAGNTASTPTPQANAASTLQRPAATAAAVATSSSVDVALTASAEKHTLPLSAPVTGSIFLHEHGGKYGDHVGLGARGNAGNDDGDACPPFPTIVLTNPRPFAVQIDIDGLSFQLGCTLNHALYGVSAFQTVPAQAVVSAVKAGDLAVAGNQLTFTPQVTTLTLAPKSETDLAILSESSTTEVTLPTVPGASTILTSNAPSVPALNLSYANATGAPYYNSTCANAFDAMGHLASALVGTQLLGTPKLFCQLTPKLAPTLTFGTTPNFAVNFAKTDIGLLQLDGPNRENACTVTGPSQENCGTTSFQIGASGNTFQQAIISNAVDLTACVPAAFNTDCNGSAAKATHFPQNAGSNQFLVANDPTYVLPAFGGYALSVSPASAGVCSINVGPDAPLSDDPPGYYDPQALSGSTATAATYPADGKVANAEFDIATHGSGTCSINVTETTGLGRTLAFSIPVI